MLTDRLANLYHTKEKFHRPLPSNLFHSILNVYISNFGVTEKNNIAHVFQTNPKIFQKVNKFNTRKFTINKGPAKQVKQNTNCTSAGERLLNSSKDN